MQLQKNTNMSWASHSAIVSFQSFRISGKFDAKEIYQKSHPIVFVLFIIFYLLSNTISFPVLLFFPAPVAFGSGFYVMKEENKLHFLKMTFYAKLLQSTFYTVLLKFILIVVNTSSLTVELLSASAFMQRPFSTMTLRSHIHQLNDCIPNKFVIITTATGVIVKATYQ